MILHILLFVFALRNVVLRDVIIVVVVLFVLNLREGLTIVVFLLILEEAIVIGVVVKLRAIAVSDNIIDLVNDYVGIRIFFYDLVLMMMTIVPACNILRRRGVHLLNSFFGLIILSKVTVQQ